MVNRMKLITSVLFLLLFTLGAFAEPKTLTGTVTDTMCGKKHMMAGKSAAECTRECMKHKGNWTYALVVGDKVYGLAGDTKKFDTLAGQQVKVTGEVNDNKIAVQTISPIKQ
ncbi:MAG: hypothetical protein ACM3JB_00075 [Acidobacteriaceae bacterium]